MGKRYHYIYKVEFPTRGWYYYGIHSTDDLNDGYSGSPVTHRSKWENHDWFIEPVEFFDSREEAAKVEYRITKNTMNDPYSLNENAGGYFSIETCIRGGQSGGTRITEKHCTNNSELQQLKSLKRWEKDPERKGLQKLLQYNIESGHLKRISQESAVQRSKPIIVTFPDGSEQEFFGAAETERQLSEYSVNRFSIGRCALGKQQSHRNLLFRFK